MVMTMAMAFPGMSPAQNYRTIFLGPVKNPKPHDGTQSLSGDSVPTLRLMYSHAFVGNAMSVSTSHLSFSSRLLRKLQYILEKIFPPYQTLALGYRVYQISAAFQRATSFYPPNRGETKSSRENQRNRYKKIQKLCFYLKTPFLKLSTL